jgi:hypothetical protein
MKLKELFLRFAEEKLATLLKGKERSTQKA